MEISLNWIKDYVKHGASSDKLAQKLTMAGLEVESVRTGKGDTIFELEVTPNRADCLSMIGMSREIAAVFNKPLVVPKTKTNKLSSSKVEIKIEDTKDCGKYIGTVIEGIRVGKISDNIKKRIESLGSKSISNIVDITNFVMLEQGQPLHAFDYDKLEGGKVIVRRAKKGEKIIAIDGQEYKLDPSILIIADAKKPVAIAGIMGGKETEVTPFTKNILLESAYFDPILTRRASRKLGLSSDSCYRFERGVDFEGVQKGSYRAIELILSNAGGKIIKHNCVGKAKHTVNKTISISKHRINSYLGTELTSTKIKTIFKALEFSLKPFGKDSFKISAPSFRSDIKDDVDLIEEIARIIGYDELPTSIPSIPMTDIPTSEGWKSRKRIREIMQGQGFNETVTFSLVSEKDAIKTNLTSEDFLKITNPLSLDQEVLQSNALVSLLPVVASNINRGQKDLRLYENTKVYHANGKENNVLSLLMTGKVNDDWRISNKNVSFFDLKGSVDQVFSKLTKCNLEFSSGKLDFLEVKQSALIFQGKKEIGFLGKVRADVLSNWNIKEKNIFFAQLNISKCDLSNSNSRYQVISEYPSIVRDVSLAVKSNVMFKDVKALIHNCDSTILKDVKFKEEYLGDKIPTGHRGLVFSLTYQSKNRTLREEEVNSDHNEIETALIEKLGAIRR